MTTYSFNDENEATRLKGTLDPDPGTAGVTSFAKQGDTALTGAVTISGGSNVTLTQTGQDIAIAASGGGSTTSRELTTGAGHSVSIANGAAAPLNFGAKLSGDTLLDLTTPTAPTAVANGVYAVSCAVNVSAMTAGGYVELLLEMDASGDDASSQVDILLPTSGGWVTIALTYYVPAAGGIILTATNQDGVASRDFTVYGTIQQVS